MPRDAKASILAAPRPTGEGGATGSDARGATSTRHVAIIMDGNGRWATSRGWPRLVGHREGVEALRAIIRVCPDLGIGHLTLYAFSTENWRRPREEVSGLMNLFRGYLRSEADALVRDGVRISFIGDPAPLADDIRRMMTDLERRTHGNERLRVAMALNYGARAELTRAIRTLATRAATARDRGEPRRPIQESDVEAALDTAEFPTPDLLIRTGGEMRLSNFLLWQAADAELVFTPELWPDFTPTALARVLAANP